VAHISPATGRLLFAYRSSLNLPHLAQEPRQIWGTRICDLASHEEDAIPSRYLQGNLDMAGL
jgi:hypothetical protein